MSAANNSLRTTSQPIPTLEVSLPQENKLICGICESDIAIADKHLTCVKDKCRKVTCVKCINIMIGMLFAQPTLNYPLKCGSCLTAFNNTDVETMIVDEKSYEKYIACILPLYWLDDCLNDSEALAQCPFCPYLEIHTTDACPMQFFTCQHPNCRKRSCLICLNAIQDDVDESRHRSSCCEYQYCKTLIKEAIEAGSVRRCPHCQLAGVKDNNCTHMCCQRCRGTWCYFCGNKERDCNVDDGEDLTLSNHNVDWKVNPDRCPMYLENIVEIDDRWPLDNEECVEYFHRCLILRNLYEVIEQIGEETVSDLNDQFGIIDACNYSIDDINDEENRTLIQYKFDDT